MSDRLKPRCPKCGARKEVVLHWEVGTLKTPTNLLKAVCLRCKFWWKQQPLDARTLAPTDQEGTT